MQGGGVEVEFGVLELEARHLNAPYLKLLKTGRPWIIAKWAMSLDGKMATAGGESRWISNEQFAQSGAQTAGTDGRDYRGTGNRAAGRSPVDRTASGTAHCRYA